MSGQDAAVRETPLLLTGAMVRATIEGRKTQTRRILRHPDRLELDGEFPLALHGSTCRSYCEYGCGAVFFDGAGRPVDHRSRPSSKTPFGGKGDRLWVRETFQPLWADPDVAPGSLKRPAGWKIGYPATDGLQEYMHVDRGLTTACKPGIHMPRWASRLTLKVTGVRIERLQDISEEAARAEGVTLDTIDGIGGEQPIIDTPRRGRTKATHPHVLAFAVLWDSINGDRAPWTTNPWVWVVSFTRVGSAA